MQENAGRGIQEEGERKHIEFLHEIGRRFASADPLHDVLDQVVGFISSVVNCDACLIYVLEGDKLVLQASKIPHEELVGTLDIGVGQGITGWVAEHREPVALATRAGDDPRFKRFALLPEDQFEAFLSVPILSRDRLVGVINVQHRRPHNHSQREIRLISTIGFLVGAEVELARLETENLKLAERLEERKIVERAKGILQRDLQLSEEDAYLTLKRYSRQKRKSMREIAEAILMNEELLRGAKGANG